MVDLEDRRAALLDAIEKLLADKQMVAIAIEGDDKYYLTKNAYRIEIRDDNSNVWDAYVMLPSGNADGDKYKEYLASKYLSLVSYSDPKHFKMREGI